jgi:ATP-dependent protease Clp ATPase subunit
MKNVIGQDTLIKEVNRIFDIFKSSNCEIRPHFFLTGDSGSGKTFTIKNMVSHHKLSFVEVNAAQLTKEGTSGNSVSKALSPLMQVGGKPAVCFVDEFDKLFISGNSNSSHAHESTTGVQNEFLKILESDVASVYGDYGKYINANVKNVLFIFSGAFNNEPEIDLDRLRELGIKTEFLGRVGLVYNTRHLEVEDLYTILDSSELFKKYMKLFSGVDEEKARLAIKAHIRDNYEHNTLGARMVNTLINQYFIKGGLTKGEAKVSTFQNKLTFDGGDN